MKPRTVFGRRLIEMDGQKYWIEMKADYLLVRRWHRKEAWRLPFRFLVQFAKGLLPL